MTKLLKIFISGLLVFISINSLYAFEIPFIGGNSEKIILNTNEMNLSYSQYGGFTGSYDLFEVEGKNGFRATFSIGDNSFIATNTVIVYTAFFSNANLIEVINKIDTNKPGQALAMGLLILAEFNCDVYKSNQKINKTGFMTPYFNFEKSIFNNELIFKDSFNQTYKLKLSDKYKDIIYKKIMIYQRKKDELIKQK